MAFGEHTIPSIATCSRPTAAPGPRVSQAGVSRLPTPARGSQSGPACRRLSDSWSRPCRGCRRRGRAVRSGLPGGRDAHVDANVVMLIRRGLSRFKEPASTTVSPGSARHRSSTSRARDRGVFGSGPCSAGEAAGRHPELGEAARDPSGPRAGRLRSGVPGGPRALGVRARGNDRARGVIRGDARRKADTSPAKAACLPSRTIPARGVLAGRSARVRSRRSGEGRAARRGRRRQQRGAPSAASRCQAGSA